MRHWEKSKKDLRRTSNDREFEFHDNKKKKLKPIEKTKYRTRGFDSEED